MEIISVELKNNLIGFYKLEQTLGTGAFGKVKLAVDNRNNQKVAIKIIEKQNIQLNDDMIRIKREMNYLKTLNHPNIIKVKEVSNKFN